MEGLHESVAWAYDRLADDRCEGRFSELATDDITFWVRGEPEVIPFAGTFTGREGVADFERRFSDSSGKEPGERSNLSRRRTWA